MSNKKTRTKVTAGRSKEKGLFKLLLAQTAQKHGLTVLEEYKFAEKRKFRADFAITELKTLCEYEGIIAGKARHTTITGYTNDCIKYNLAASLGWKVLRYTALNYGQIEGDITNLLTNKK